MGIPPDPLDGEGAAGLVLVHGPEPVAFDLLVVRHPVLTRQQLTRTHWTLDFGHCWAAPGHIPSVVREHGRIVQPELHTPDDGQLLPLHGGEA